MSFAACSAQTARQAQKEGADDNMDESIYSIRTALALIQSA